MKRLSLLSLVLLVAILFAQDGRAQDHTRFSLPEGALARLGKGSIGWGDRVVAYSPDGTRLAIPSTAIPNSPTAWPHPA